MSKRIQSFFQPVSKKPKTSNVENQELTRSNHPTYPFPIANLPSHISNALRDHQPKPAQSITNQPDLDLLYFQPLLPSPVARDLFHFLRAELPFYRVQYTIRRGGIDTQINTPRFTTVFGVDETSRFQLPPNPPQSESTQTPAPPAQNLIDTQKQTPVPKTKYARSPRPIPPCLDALRQLVESVSDGKAYNFCLVNYYASGNDSITYHSDDERFLGTDPAIASLSLGAKRDFLMKHKPNPTQGGKGSESKPLKFPLASGDMVIMRGPTQANWLHSIPKRKAEVGGVGQGRINITFRKAVIPGGTDNYYRYNVGDGGVHRWSEEKGEMVLVDDERKQNG